MISTEDVIQLLPDHVANQIAAGEVVQRPASVVKELLENAVDAGAEEIDLIVKDAGRTLIQVVDNGSGMSITDFRLAFERHATSKIRTTEDIFQIHTKGFRGEALASIAAVAQIEATTKTANSEIGTRLIIEGGAVRDQLPAATPQGTSIAVKNLFFNVPARRNFLKSNQIELRHIQDEFIRVAMAHEQIKFRFFHNDSEIYSLRKSNLKQRIVQIFGKKTEAQLVPIHEETEVVRINGFTGKPENAKKKRGEQFFFVNQRFIRSGYLHKAIMDAYENLLPAQYTPSYFLFFEIDPSKIDINIHPTKTEIKFEDEHTIFAILRSAVKHALGQFNIAPSLDFEQNPDWAFIPGRKKEEVIRQPEIRVDRNYNPFEKPPGQSQIRPLQELYSRMNAFETESNAPEFVLSKEEFELVNSNIIQWLHKYLVVQQDETLLIIDQHRAHQLILFEKLKAVESENTLSQRLLFPIEIPSNTAEIQSLKNFETALVNFGFDVEFARETIYVNALPSEVNQDIVPALFSDFIQKSETHDQIDFNLEIAKIIAKNTAVKKGQPLLPEQCANIVNELLKLAEPGLSPFGKPIFVRVQESEILKKMN
ncbi:MAG: DNA mismatch repair endonuclease MutL [Weeksellaceae bacterium]